VADPGITAWLEQQKAERAKRPAYQARLLVREKSFMAAVVARVLIAVPEAIEIMLHGSRARSRFRSNSDWDFIVFLDNPPRERLWELSAKGGPLGLNRLPDHPFRRLHLVPADAHKSTPLTDFAREEGVSIWQKQRETLDISTPNTGGVPATHHHPRRRPG
jgi:predicted nucleotidyltransferase